MNAESSFDITDGFMREAGDEARALVEAHGIKGAIDRVYMADRPMLLSALPFAAAQLAFKPHETPDFDQFVGHPEIATLAKFLHAISMATYKDRKRAAEDASSALRLYWMWLCWDRRGRRLYEISRGLGQRLQATELHGLKTDDLRLPFQTIYIMIPDLPGVAISNPDTGSHPLRGAYITEGEVHGARAWFIMLWGPPKISEYDDALFHFTVPLPEGIPLEEALDRVSDHMARLDLKSANAFAEVWRPLFALLMNAVIYATWPDADLQSWIDPGHLKARAQVAKHPKGSHKKARAMETLANTPPRLRVILGPNVKYESPELSSPGSCRVRVRTMVTGHWRRQPVGPGRKERKLIWISPFWRGEGPESNPTRVLGES